EIHEFVADRRAKQSAQMMMEDPSLRALAESMNEYGLMNPYQEEEQPQRDVVQRERTPAAIALRRMFPLPPPQNQIIGTDERQLQEMLVAERKSGRDAVRIMKANQRMDTGVVPDYDVIWDKRRNQWTMRP
ncbi:MAG: hypothetical protein GWN86_23490, partial [Desulfobacterales bacterium]|nr:hypothetical protein [Desulfobacterales bacterium]